MMNKTEKRNQKNKKTRKNRKTKQKYVQKNKKQNKRSQTKRKYSGGFVIPLAKMIPPNTYINDVQRDIISTRIIP
jgi:hypothetical protein